MEARPGDLIGREVELHALVDAIDGDRATVVVGEAGIGKTTLIRAAAAAAGRRAHEGGGFATLVLLPYLALRRAAGVGLGGDRAAVAAQVERQVGPDVLFIDDLQWVDIETLAVLELLVGRSLVLAAIRAGDPGADAALELARRAGMQVMELDGLADEAAAVLVRRARPGLSEGQTAGIVERAAGNPLLLEELAVGGEASAALQRALSTRVERLEPDGRATVELLAVAGRPVPRSMAGAGVVAAIEAGVVRERGSDVEVRHALVAAAILDRLSPDRRSELHGRLAELMDGGRERATHLLAAGRAEEAATAALGELDGVTDPRDRAALLLIAAEASPAATSMSMRLRAARALDEVSEWASIVRIFDDGDDREAPDGQVGTPEQLVERDAVLAHATFALGDPARSRRLLDGAAARPVEAGSDAAARLAIETATFLVNVEGRVGEAVALLDATLAAGPAPEARRDLELLRASIVLLATGQGDPSVVGVGIEEAFAAGRYRTATDRARVMQYVLLFGANPEVALGFLLSEHARFDAVGVGSVALEFKADAVVAAVLAGRLDQAVLIADELLEQPAPPRARQTAEIHRARALTLLGRFDQAGEALAATVRFASPDYLGRGEALWTQAELAFWSGRATAADELAAASLGIAPPIPVAHVNPMLVRAWARQELGRDIGPPIEVALTPSLGGAPGELDGLRAWAADDPATAALAFEAAAAGWAGFNELHRLLCRWAAGESRRRAGEGARAVALLTDVLEAARAAGIEPLAARVRRSLRLAGVRAVADSTRQERGAGGLTARERELVGLVERGLTNVEIARRLGLGRPTVARILASAMTKLGVSSRAQLAAGVGA